MSDEATPAQAHFPSQDLSGLRFRLHGLSWERLRTETGALIRSSREFLSPPEEPKDPSLAFMSPRRLVGAGRLIVLVFGVGLILWVAFAPLQSAIMAPGTVVVESHVKTIQHLEGGIVRDILVNDGQNVRKGQLLVRLDGTQARANLQSLMDESDALEAEEARLEAERDGRDSIAFPPDLVRRAGEPKVAQAMQGEESTFVSQRETLAKQVDILRQRSDENVRIIAGLKDESVAVGQQIALVAREIGGVQMLYAKGLATLPRLLTLQRQAADLSGQRSQLTEKVAQTELTSGENDLQIMNLKNQQLGDVVKELRDEQTKRFDAVDRTQAARDVLTRLDIRAPVAGKIVDLAVHAQGAVVSPGGPIMKVVPEKDSLEVDAHIRPEDADRVQVGMKARVYFSAYQSRRLPIILGSVTNVSADRQVDPHSGQVYFTVNVSVDAKPLRNYPGVKLVPGLPVDVALDTGSHTALDYFLEPITDVLRNGMKEK
ncbi:MAG: HlyD family type I secretion periplasmic adaptor subunit [Rhizomicrobium sp.]